MKNIYKQFFSIFIPIWVVVTFFVVLFLVHEINIHRETIINDEIFSVRYLDRVIVEDVQEVVVDLLHFSSHHLLRRNIEKIDKSSLEGISELFLSVAETKKFYDQIRLIDGSGMELVRVNYKTNFGYIVGKTNLQNKQKRYYFYDTFKGTEGVVYISPFDLNIEHGEIEMPLNPVIRFGVPVFNISGKKRGVLVINYSGKKLLSYFTSLSNKIKKEVMLLNNNGYWLKGRDSSEEWGFMYNNRKKITMSHIYPELWSEISSNDSGQIENSDGVYTFKTVYPLSKDFISSTGSGESFTSSKAMLSGHDYFWKIVTFISREELKSHTYRVMYLWIPAYLVVIFVFVLIIWKFSVSDKKRRDIEMNQKIVIRELKESQNTVNTLGGLIPICAKCKKVRDDKGYWEQVEQYIEHHSEAKFSHGMCEKCEFDLYNGQPWYQRTHPEKFK